MTLILISAPLLGRLYFGCAVDGKDPAGILNLLAFRDTGQGAPHRLTDSKSQFSYIGLVLYVIL